MSTDAQAFPPLPHPPDEDERGPVKYHYSKWNHRDALTDPNLRACSIHARLFWRELVDCVHGCFPCGHAMLNGLPMTIDEMRSNVGPGFTRSRVRKIVVELETRGVFSRTEDGAIYSRRMVREHDEREQEALKNKRNGEFGRLGAEHGKKGGRGNKKNPLKAVGGTEFDAAGNPPRGFLETPHTESESELEERSSAVPNCTTDSIEKPGTGSETKTPTPSELMDRHATEVCTMLTGHGILSAVPGDAMLRRYLAEGITACELEAIAGRKGDIESGKVRHLNWVLQAVKKEREKAAKEVIPPRPKPVSANPPQTPGGGFPAGAIRPAEPYVSPRPDTTPGSPPKPSVRGELAKLRATFPAKKVDKAEAEALAAAVENSQETEKI